MLHRDDATARLRRATAPARAAAGELHRRTVEHGSAERALHEHHVHRAGEPERRGGFRRIVTGRRTTSETEKGIRAIVVATATPTAEEKETGRRAEEEERKTTTRAVGRRAVRKIQIFSRRTHRIITRLLALGLQGLAAEMQILTAVARAQKETAVDHRRLLRRRLPQRLRLQEVALVVTIVQ